jgi:protein TonB
MGSSFIRGATALGLSVCVAAGLFWLMHYLILSAEREMEEVASFNTVDFVRVQEDDRVETRERSKPEPPQPDEPPPPPPQLQARAAQSEALTGGFGMPNVSIPTNMTGGPMLAQQNAELIPVVRLAPQYPRQAARAGQSGWVRLRNVVNPDGSVREARAVESEPKGLFEAAAVTAAMRGRFRPRLVDGEAVEASGDYTVTFSLGGH